ncbi:MAG: CotH kinase family protein [Muribaculaceae bacterium]|nr:CotH kinase family protein [Muribaculaceae bacterium]
MQKLYRTLLIAGALAAGSPVASAHLVINEIMQSNIDCIMDDFNEFPDSWVELYNPGPDAENLADYSLGTKDKAKKAYRLPSGSIPAGKFMVIYCDKAEQGRHTDFRLESGKDCAVYLFKNDEIVDHLEGLKKQPAPNIAYGRETDNADKWGYQAVPTPGASNCGTTYKEILGDPVFSVPGKVSSDVFDLELSLPADAPEGTVIRYTLDGKEPTEASPTYSNPIHMSVTRTVRAKLFCDGYLSPRSLTHSYIKHPREVTLPVVSMVTNKDYFYDNKLGIYVQGNYTNHTPNYEYDWRRPVNIEYFEGADTPSSINQLGETRVKGGATRGSALKSLAVYANKRFGEKRFNYEFFPDQTPGIDEFKSFEMRNSGNDFDYMYMRDAIIQQSMGMNCDLDWQPSRPAIFYINGEYKGILNIRPRSNEDYVYSYYDGLEDLDMLENWWELKEGSIDSFNAFKAFYEEKDHSFSEFDALMDTGEFCNLMIMGTFFDNKDFPGNNIVMWRPQADGGRWRWVSKDTDFGMGLYGERANYPTLNWITSQGYDNNKNDWANKWEHTRLFRRLLDTPEFKEMFIDRCAIYMGDFLTPDAIIARIDDRYNSIKTEYKFHRDQINPWWPVYSQEVDWGKEWTRQRHTFFYNHLASFFGLKNPVTLTIGKGDSDNRNLAVNGIPLRTKEFNGKYFPDRNLTVSSMSDTDGLYVNGWNVTVTSGGQTTTDTYTSETLSIPMPQASAVVITPILGTEPLAVEEVRTDINPTRPCDIYDTAGRHLGILPAGASLTFNPSPLTLTKGIYILRQGTASRKVTLK